MSEHDNTRRDFLKVATAAVAGSSLTSVAEGVAAGTPPILNHHPQMHYRRLGKTGFMISEVALGGHGGRQVEDRVPVLERAVELGLNYVDNNIAGECDLYGAAMAKSKTAGRHRWFIGFASWPEKVTTEYESQLTPDGMMHNIEARLKSYHTDMLDLWRPVGATWGAGQKMMATMLMVSERTLEMVVQVFEKARQQGKVRYLGISAHNPKVFRRVLEHYPQFSVIIFPYLFLTQEFGGDSLLKLAHEKEVGVIGLKPFGAGTTFGLKPQQLKWGPDKVDPRAHVMVKQMLQEQRISAIIPGVQVAEQINENVRGAYERDKPFTPEEKQALAHFREQFHAHLTPAYHWLRDWEYV
jgi:aryl-alcohol dehydrogenase-like predicted oxidoreductase